MGKIAGRGCIKIFAGLISGDDAIFEKAGFLLTKKLGPVEMESGTFPFNHTSYYTGEMGGGLKRKFLSFRRERGIDGAHRLKIFTNRLEERFSYSGKRRINIDPGYLTLSKVVLLTTKDYTHRTYLKDGIYAEATLFYEGGSYRPREWTYPDYKTREYIEFFNAAREIFAQAQRKR